MIVGWQAFRSLDATTRRDARLALAFGFGLLHGFGFANAMQTLSLPVGQLPLALAGFNVGVELAQLAIVLTVWPPLALLRARASIGVAANVIRACAVAVIATGSFWFVERVLAP